MFGQIHLREILPSRAHAGNPIRVQKQASNITISYQTTYPNGKPKPPRFQPLTATVAPRIALTEELVETLGLYQGDGQTATTSKSYQATRFSNSCPELIRQFLRVMHTLGVRPRNLKAQVTGSTALQAHTNDASLIHEWSRITHIPKGLFYTCRWNRSKYPDSQHVPKGTLSVIYANSSFRLIFDALFNYVRRKATHHPSMAAAFLRGWIAADGCMYYSGAHRQLILAAKDPEDRAYARVLLHLLEIKPNQNGLRPGKEAVIITGYTNLEQVRHFRLCELHPEKRAKFTKAFETYRGPSYRKGEGQTKVIEALQTQPLSTNTLATSLKRKPNAIRAHLRALERVGLVRRADSIRTAGTGRPAELWELAVGGEHNG